MQQFKFTALPDEAGSTDLLPAYLFREFSIHPDEIEAIVPIHMSIDARRAPVRYNWTVDVYFKGEQPEETYKFDWKNVSSAKEVAVVGAGPAGLFAALRLIELGLKPVVFERGKDIRERRRDLAAITKNNTINPESNYCFGEGGAGTYSDGKLYTRSSKRGDVKRILHILVKHGADPRILFESHPHIGTNKLPGIIENIRKTILDCGGIIRFNAKVTDIHVAVNQITGLTINDSEKLPFSQVILATGHSARDIFTLLHERDILIEAKPFALGVRIEHPQSLIDSIQYKCGPERHPLLPAASYSLVENSGNRGIFSFCMCPGGIIAPAMTNPGEIVVNGWSPSKRNNPYANSGMVVSILESDFKPFAKAGPLAGMYFQSTVEQTCFNLGDQSLKAPAQRMTDFIANKVSADIPSNSYIPGTISRNLSDVLPPQVVKALRFGMQSFGRKLKGYLTEDAVLLATESRTSSPVRIPRDKQTLEHVQVKGLYPCAEGAGYAGGIVSAAMDGENCASSIGG